ncbi:10837_t:CDS:2, partial [Rhizophagus irregularis]
IEDIISEQTEHQIEPNNSTAINKEVKGKSKRNNFNDDDKDDVNHNIKSKKIKLSNNKGN